MSFKASGNDVKILWSLSTKTKTGRNRENKIFDLIPLIPVLFGHYAYMHACMLMLLFF